jgi:hypothetical protein
MNDGWGEVISPAHAGMLRAAFVQANKKAWCYFVPFLCAFSLPPNRIVRVLKHGQSVCLLLERPDGIDFLCPPLPFDLKVFDAVLAKVLAANGERSTRVLWVDETDATLLDASLFELKAKDEEYIYDPHLIANAEGRAFRDIRKRVHRFEREHASQFRTMLVDDVSACHELLKYWRKRQGRKHPFLLDWGYTKAALDAFDQWTSEFLTGWCLEIDGKMKAFALVGETLPQMAHFFIAKTDPDVWGLSEYLRWRVYQTLSHYQWVNDAGDLGLDGLRQFKMKFRPVDRLQVFSAEIRKEGL